MTSYCNALPSTEKPWLKYYLKPVEQEFTDCSIYEFLKNHNDQESESVALNYFGKKITYKRMFSDIERIAAALQVWGVSKGDFVSVVGLNIPEFYELVYAVNKVGRPSENLP